MNTYMLLANASAFGMGVEQLRSKLMLLAFVLVVIGIWESGWKAGGDPKLLLGILLKMIIIIMLIAWFPTIMQKGKECFDNLKAILTPQPHDKFQELLTGKLPEVDADIFAIGHYIASIAATFFQFWGLLGIKIVRFFQLYAIGCLTAISPLMIGFIAISYTQSIGIRFITTSLSVMMWSLGFILVDLFSNYLGAEVFGGMMAAGVTAQVAGALAIVSWPAAVGAMLIAALVPTFFYIATPMIVAKLLAGANAGVAAAWGGLSNMAQGAQHVTRGGVAIQQMQMASSLRSAGNQTGAQNTAFIGGKIERPPNPIA